MLCVTFLLLPVLIVGFAGNAGATAIYNASAYGELRITGIFDSSGVSLTDVPSGLSIQFDSPPIDSDYYFYSEGTASATASASGTVAGDSSDLHDGADLQADASGVAYSPPISYAESDAWADAVINFENLSLSEVFTIDFSLTYAYSVSSSVDVYDPFIEAASASIDIYVEEFVYNKSDPDDLIDYELLADIEDYSDTFEGGGLFADSGTVLFSIVVSPTMGLIHEIYFATEANDPFIDGFAGSDLPVPEPATVLLLGSGLIGLAGFGRKKFKK